MLSRFEFQQYKPYWLLRIFFRRHTFYIKKILFGIRTLYQNWKEGSRTLLSLMGLVFWSLVSAIIIIIVLEGFEVLVNSFFSLKYFHLPQFVKTILQAAYDKLGSFETALNTLLATIISVSGIFIALYFTVISVVASSAYSKVPSNIRELLLKEKFGNIYMRVLAILAGTALLLLCLKVLGRSPGILSISFVTFLSLLGIFSFVQLGLRTFNFFDPITLIDPIVRGVHKNIRLATATGYRWDDPSFQNFYRQQVNNYLDSSETLIKISLREERLTRPSLVSIVAAVENLLYFYSFEKSKIPSKSRWYELTPKYKSWFLANEAEISTALATGTSIRPEFVPHNEWFENKIFKMINFSISELVKDGDLEAVHKIIGKLALTFRRLGENLSVKQGKEYLDDISSILWSIPDLQKENSKGWHQRNKLAIAVYDMYGIAILSLVLGFLIYLLELDLKKLQAIMGKIYPISNKSIYSGLLPYTILSRLEFLSDRVAFERAVEGVPISPKWYTDQLIVMELNYHAKIGFDEIFCILDNHIVKKCIELEEQKRPILAVSHARRGLEMIAKIKAQKPRIESNFDEFEKVRINRDLPWSVVEWSKLEKQLEDTHKKLVIIISKCIDLLSKQDWVKEEPDYFGEAYNIISEECYDSLYAKDDTMFYELFPAQFTGAFSAYNKLKEELKDWGQEAQINFMIDPIVDLLDMSGYARIYSELHSMPRMWLTCETLWRQYIKSIPNPAEVIKFICSVDELKTSMMRIAQRDVLRANWEIRLHKQFRKMGLIEDRLGTMWEERKVKHSSHLVRALCKGGFRVFVSAREVFITLFLLKLPEAKGVKYKVKHNLEKDLERERARDRSGTDEG